jgi:hypothetical protein
MPKTQAPVYDAIQVRYARLRELQRPTGFHWWAAFVMKAGVMACFIALSSGRYGTSENTFRTPESPKPGLFEAIRAD